MLHSLIFVTFQHCKLGIFQSYDFGPDPEKRHLTLGIYTESSSHREATFYLKLNLHKKQKVSWSSWLSLCIHRSLAYNSIQFAIGELQSTKVKANVMLLIKAQMGGSQCLSVLLCLCASDSQGFVIINVSLWILSTQWWKVTKYISITFSYSFCNIWWSHSLKTRNNIYSSISTGIRQKVMYMYVC